MLDFRGGTQLAAVSLTLLIAIAGGVTGQSRVTTADLEAVFQGARIVDLRTSKVPSVVTLREQVKIPSPTEPVKVKVFVRERLPLVLQPIFQNDAVRGVTIAGKYVAILRTETDAEYKDVLSHELVHAYVTLVSPRPLPFWFQEGSAVKFSTGSARRIYATAPPPNSDLLAGRVVEVDPTYKQKLQSFKYLIERVGKQEFYDWYRRAVETGVVDTSNLLRRGTPSPIYPLQRNRSLPYWVWIVAAWLIAVIILIGYRSSLKHRGYD